MDADLWTYNEGLDRPKTLDGFDGRNVVTPAKAIVRLDIPTQQIFLRLTKDQIKDSPEFDGEADPSARRDAIGAYYGPTF